MKIMLLYSSDSEPTISQAPSQRGLINSSINEPVLAAGVSAKEKSDA